MKPIANLEQLEEFLGVSLVRFDSMQSMSHQGIRLSRVCKSIESAIKRGDPVAAEIAFRVITGDPSLPFGKLIKSGFARTLKQQACVLSSFQRSALIDKTIELLELEFCPREAEDYCKMIKKFDGPELMLRLQDIRVTNEKSRVLAAQLVP